MRQGFPRFFRAAVAVALLCGGVANAQEKRKVAFFGFELINTSPEPVGEGERRRIALVGELFAKMLTDSGRYEITPLSDALRRKIAASAEISGCNGCQIEWAREAGADIAAFGTVQKVSNLILNENIYMDSVADGAPFYSRSVDIRGNTDESWSRGMKYLLGEYFLKQK
ncbi:MAG: DUF3280 domain-containing protein [Methylocystis sp.]